MFSFWMLYILIFSIFYFLEVSKYSLYLREEEIGFIFWREDFMDIYLIYYSGGVFQNDFFFFQC